jgi:hypothetical protein
MPFRKIYARKQEQLEICGGRDGTTGDLWWERYKKVVCHRVLFQSTTLAAKSNLGGNWDLL